MIVLYGIGRTLWGTVLDGTGLGWSGLDWTGSHWPGNCTLAFRDVARSRWDLELGEMKPKYHVFARNLVTLSGQCMQIHCYACMAKEVVSKHTPASTTKTRVYIGTTQAKHHINGRIILRQQARCPFMST